MKNIVCIFGLLFLAFGLFAEMGILTIQLENVQIEEKGQIIINIYNDENDWNNPEQVFRQKIVTKLSSKMTIKIDSLEISKDYAVQVIHDANENNELDFRKFPFPKPKEGVGLSNNKFRFGPPRFKDAQFILESTEQEIRIEMQY